MYYIYWGENLHPPWRSVNCPLSRMTMGFLRTRWLGSRTVFDLHQPALCRTISGHTVTRTRLLIWVCSSVDTIHYPVCLSYYSKALHQGLQGFFFSIITFKSLSTCLPPKTLPLHIAAFLCPFNTTLNSWGKAILPSQGKRKLRQLRAPYLIRNQLGQSNWVTVSFTLSLFDSGAPAL